MPRARDRPARTAGRGRADRAPAPRTPQAPARRRATARRRRRPAASPALRAKQDFDAAVFRRVRLPEVLEVAVRVPFDAVDALVVQTAANQDVEGNLRAGRGQTPVV